MNKRLLSLAVAGIMLLGLASVASAGVPDPVLSTASSAGSGTVLIVPSGTGGNLGALGLTVSVTVVDATGAAIAGYAFQDVWLDDNSTGEILLCQGGSVADANTDASGITTISGTISGGGYTQSGLQVFLAGVPLAHAALPIDANSCDVVADLVVNSVDLGDFATDFRAYGDSGGTVYNFRSDFVFDGAINLPDVGEYAIHNGETCP